MLKWWRTESKAIGASWIFPSVVDPSKPFSTHAIQWWWRELRDAAGIPAGERYGWHSFRRKFATEMKRIPLKDLAALGGWRSAQTILTCYMKPDIATQRTALDGRRRLSAGGLT